MAASRMAVALWILLGMLLLVTAIAGFRASYVIIVLFFAYLVMFQFGARIRRR
ncbi:MAG: hypothetical protein M0Z96_07385 [Actinomycetota bacterium]|nr:hypothetical protein [Actinomycetota bacterium]